MANVVVVTGQKGGVGKTVISLAIAWWLEQNQLSWWGIDTDIANQTFVDLGGGLVEGVTFYDDQGFHMPHALNAIVDEIVARKNDDETIIIDVGAGQLNVLIAGLRARRLLGEEPVVPITIAYVLLEDSASISTIAKLAAMADQFVGVSWLIVLNERDGPVTQYEKSQTREALLQRNASELTIPALRDKTVFEALRGAHMTPTEFCNPANSQSWSARCQLLTWLINTGLQFDSKAALFTGQTVLHEHAQTPSPNPQQVEPQPSPSSNGRSNGHTRRKAPEDTKQTVAEREAQPVIPPTVAPSAVVDPPATTLSIAALLDEPPTVNGPEPDGMDPQFPTAPEIATPPLVKATRNTGGNGKFNPKPTVPTIQNEVPAAAGARKRRTLSDV